MQMDTAGQDMNEGKIPVSVAMVTHNEEANIAAALESVKDFEEIVVIDAFSDDRTVEICRQYMARVICHEWQGYARQKQMAVDQARGNWVLILDADERVTPGLKVEIIRIIQDDQGFSGFYIPRKNFFLGKWIRHSGWWPDNTLRLFKKDSGYIEPRKVHEKVVIEGRAGYLKGHLEHYTYRSIRSYMEKMENYSTLAANEMAEKGTPSRMSMVINPVFTFVKMYFLRRGFLDGWHGFVLAAGYGFYTFLKYAKAWEAGLKNRSRA